jgi:hypothetical protein
MQKMAEWICGEKTSPLGYQYLDVVNREELIRCNECKHGDPCNDGEIYCEKDIGTIETAVHKPDWFCADGERKETI